MFDSTLSSPSSPRFPCQELTPLQEPPPAFHITMRDVFVCVSLQSPFVLSKNRGVIQPQGRLRPGDSTTAEWGVPETFPTPLPLKTQLWAEVTELIFFLIIIIIIFSSPGKYRLCTNQSDSNSVWRFPKEPEEPVGDGATPPQPPWCLGGHLSQPPTHPRRWQ